MRVRSLSTEIVGSGGQHYQQPAAAERNQRRALNAPSFRALSEELCGDNARLADASSERGEVVVDLQERERTARKECAAFNALEEVRARPHACCLEHDDLRCESRRRRRPTLRRDPFISCTPACTCSIPAMLAERAACSRERSEPEPAAATLSACAARATAERRAHGNERETTKTREPETEREVEKRSLIIDGELRTMRISSHGVGTWE